MEPRTKISSFQRFAHQKLLSHFSFLWNETFLAFSMKKIQVFNEKSNNSILLPLVSMWIQLSSIHRIIRNCFQKWGVFRILYWCSFQEQFATQYSNIIFLCLVVGNKKQCFVNKTKLSTEKNTQIKYTSFESALLSYKTLAINELPKKLRETGK